MTQDPTFGPAVVVGLGGIFVAAHLPVDGQRLRLHAGDRVGVWATTRVASRR